MKDLDDGILLKVRELQKKFHMHILHDKQIHALNGVSFNLHKGEIIGLTGISGSGKSTLMKCLYRTYLASSGTIMFQSTRYGWLDLVAASDHKIIDLRRNEITYCSQFLQVIPRVPAVEVVASSCVRKAEDWPEAKEHASQLLADLGLPRELWDAFPTTFSGGEQQRINVARAIIATPRFLLIDEPTASLDQKTKDVVISKILELKDKGTSILCISHDEYTLDNMVDRRLHLSQGHLSQQFSMN